MESSAISNPIAAGSERSGDKKRKKKKKTQEMIVQEDDRFQQNRWIRNQTEQAYSSRLVLALRQVRPTDSKEAFCRREREVRAAVDRVLAVTAKGRTRWSRAILASRIRIKLAKRKRRGRGTVARKRSRHRVNILRFKSKSLNQAVVQRKAKALGRLVPGCKEETLPVILEETMDYIAALQMQIRVITALVGMNTTTTATTISGTTQISE